MKKVIVIKKSEGAADFVDLPKINEYRAFQQSMLEAGRVNIWERSEFVNNEATITIICDSAGTYDEITNFSNSLGDWRPGYEIIDEKTFPYDSDH